MARKLLHKEPKVQRGVSLPKPLYERINTEADKYGRSWNETVELVLAKAFPVASDLQNPVETSRISQPDEPFIPEEAE